MDLSIVDTIANVEGQSVTVNSPVDFTLTLLDMYRNPITDATVICQLGDADRVVVTSETGIYSCQPLAPKTAGDCVVGVSAQRTNFPMSVFPFYALDVLPGDLAGVQLDIPALQVLPSADVAATLTPVDAFANPLVDGVTSVILQVGKALQVPGLYDPAINSYVANFAAPSDVGNFTLTAVVDGVLFDLDMTLVVGAPFPWYLVYIGAGAVLAALLIWFLISRKKKQDLSTLPLLAAQP
eukprot:gnl/Ergobibamus_cyprinoides/3637.p1 GENE.gnl/Ergobibamus_cyprinoides/3637~~gnl/Ergobibamus_cyprinoides/3637.p1  ORF type:complete len:239 (-),score=69.19 gnl/Ergobibamus_cyprinoides/3637:49-765(-)